MIPKVIHYCWFGKKELPLIGKKCIESWKKYCPDYEIIEWNEENYDCFKVEYVREAYKAKKWAFVSDYARLDIIYQHGGIYLDIDVEVIQNLDSMLECACFLATETTNMIATGLGFGAEKGNINIKNMLEQYKDIHFDMGNGLYDTLPCPHRNTVPFQKLGFLPGNQIQYINGAVIYPPEYFCPIEYETKKINITKNSRTIHHYNASWITPEEAEFEEKVKEYRKHHGKIKSKCYRAFCEYQLYYDSFKIKNVMSFLVKKIARRRNRKSRKW